MNKATVIHISTVHYWQDARILHKECMSLAKAGYEVRLFIQHEGDREVNGVQIEGLPLAKMKVHRFTRVIPKMLKKVWACDRNAVLHLHDPELLIFGVLFKLWGFKVIYDVHEDLPKDMLDKDWIPIALRKSLSWFTKWFEFLTTAAFDGVITVAPEVAARFQHIRHAMIRNYPKLELFLQEEPMPGGSYAVYIGDIRDIRGGSEMTRAVNACQNILKLKLGGRIYPASYKEELIQEDEKGRLEWLGWVPHDDIPDLLKNALCGLAVLHPLEGYKEAYPVKLYEYMAAGIPVVVSDFPVWRKIIEEAACGILVDPLQPNAIANALDHLAQHPEEARAMGDRGRAMVRKKYDWTLEEKKLYELYDEVLQSY